MTNPQLSSGRAPFAVGHSRYVRLPVPHTLDLWLELRPKTPVPACGAASSLLLRHAARCLELRLDFAYSKRTRSVDFHWCTEPKDPARGAGPGFTPWLVPHAASRCFRQAGRVLTVTGVLADQVRLLRSDAALSCDASELTLRAQRWLEGAARATCPECLIAEVSHDRELAGKVYAQPAAGAFVPLEAALPR